jgi:PPP family 3-phenylpropionic acid transporter
MYYAAMASLSPFLMLRYERLGLSGDQIGLLAGLSPLVTLVGASLWGGAADATQQHQRLLKFAIGGVMVLALALSVVTQFWLLLSIVALLAFFSTPIMPLMDHSVLDLLGDQQDQYGKLRVWGAIGWGVAGPIMGQLVEWFGMGVPFYGYIAFMFGGLVIAARMPISHASIGQGWWHGVQRLAGDRRWVPFLLFALLGGVALSVVHSYLFLYMKTLEASSSLMGFALTAATLSEVAVFGLSDRLLIRLGTRKLLMLGLSAHIARVLLYSFIRAPWMVLPVQLLHGFSFSMIWVAGVSHASRLAPAGMGATVQGLFSSVFFGMGGSLGALSGGMVYERLGFPMMFRLSAIWGLLGLVLLATIGRSGSVAEGEPGQDESIGEDKRHVYRGAQDSR